MQGLCDELDVSYLKKEPVAELPLEKLVGARCARTSSRRSDAPTLKAMLVAQSLARVGGKKEELVARIISPPASVTRTRKA